MGEDRAPSAAMTWHQNREKALQELLGLMDGIRSDGVLRESEVTALDAWLADQGAIIGQDPDVVDIMHAVRRALADGFLSEAEREDLHGLVDMVLDYRGGGVAEQKQAINRLYGILRGVSADRELHEREVRMLDTWVRHNRDVLDVTRYPANIVEERVATVLADGVVTETEKADLLETLDGLLGGALEETGAVSGVSAAHPITSIAELDHAGARFCLTGKFVYGSRKTCERAIKDRGGEVRSKVTLDLDYLVVGTAASRDWAGTSHGRKIEKAVAYQERGEGLLVIAEEDWVRNL